MSSSGEGGKFWRKWLVLEKVASSGEDGRTVMS